MSVEANLYDQILEDLKESRNKYFEALCTKYSAVQDGNEYDVRTLTFFSAGGKRRNIPTQSFGYLSKYRSKNGFKKIQKLSKLTKAEMEKSKERYDAVSSFEDESTIVEETEVSVSDDDYLTLSSDDESLSDDPGEKQTVASGKESMLVGPKERQTVLPYTKKQSRSYKEKENSDNQSKQYDNSDISVCCLSLNKINKNSNESTQFSTEKCISKESNKALFKQSTNNLSSLSDKIKHIERNFEISQESLKLGSANQEKQFMPYMEEEDSDYQPKQCDNSVIRDCCVGLFNINMNSDEDTQSSTGKYPSKQLGKASFKQSIKNLSSHSDKILKSSGEFCPLSLSYNGSHPKIEKNFEIFEENLKLGSANHVKCNYKFRKPEVVYEEEYLCINALSAKKFKQDISSADKSKSVLYTPVSNPFEFVQVGTVHRSIKKFQQSMNFCSLPSPDSIQKSAKKYTVEPLPCPPAPKPRKFDLARLGLRSAAAKNKRAKDFYPSVHASSSLHTPNSVQKTFKK